MDPSDLISLALQPVALLPGVGLLIMSTQSRFNRLHDELHHVLMYDEMHAADASSLLLKRGFRLRDALVAEYVATAMIAVAGLVGGTAWATANQWLAWIVLALVGLGVAAVTIASIILVSEARSAMRILVLDRQFHLQGFGDGHATPAPQAAGNDREGDRLAAPPEPPGSHKLNG